LIPVDDVVVLGGSRKTMAVATGLIIDIIIEATTIIIRGCRFVFIVVIVVTSCVG